MPTRIHNLLHKTRERFARMPNPLVQLRQWPDSTQREQLDVLRRDGVLVLPDHVAGERLARLQAGYARMMEWFATAPPPPEGQAPPPRPHVVFREYNVDAEDGYVETLNPFRYDPALLDAALDEHVLTLVEHYWGKRCMLSQSVAVRYEPGPYTDVGSFGWHHDSLGKRASAMVLLTDCGPGDQHMTYVKGSHARVHPPGQSLRNWTDREMERFQDLEHFACTGTAGTVILFDANGMHRGNRCESTRRDALISSYCYGHYVWPFAIPRANVEALTPRQHAFLLNNPKISVVDEPPRAV